MKLIYTFLFTISAFVSQADESKIMKDMNFSNPILQEAYKASSQNRDSSSISTDEAIKIIDSKSKSAMERLAIKVPWLSELISQSVLSYNSINENDAWIERSFEHNQPVKALLDKGYDFCWLNFKKWDHIFREKLFYSMRHSAAPNLGFLDEGIILSNGVLYTIDRRARFQLSDTDYVDFANLDDVISNQSMYRFALDNVDRTCVDETRWSRVIRLLSDYPSVWFHPRSLKITIIRLNHDDYQKLLNLFSQLRINEQQSYSVEQILLAERIFNGSQVALEFNPWQYNLYGFHSKIEGLSCRDNISIDEITNTIHEACEEFIQLFLPSL